MRDLKGQDLSLSLTNAAGTLVRALSVGIEDFSCKPMLDTIEAKNLDGTRLGQSFSGWQGSMTLNLQDTAPMAFMDAYIAAVQSGEEHRVTIAQRVFNPKISAKSAWTYPKCILEFDEGPYNKGNPVKLKITWRTGEERVPG